MEEIGRWAAARGIWVVTDEIYEHLVYGDASFSSMPVLVPELGDRCVVVNGVAKTYAMTGWRVGWMLGPVDVVRSHKSPIAFHVQRSAMSRRWRLWPPGCPGTYRRFPNGRGVRSEASKDPCDVEQIPGVTSIEPKGAFYAFPSLAGVLGRERCRSPL